MICQCFSKYPRGIILTRSFTHVHLIIKACCSWIMNFWWFSENLRDWQRCGKPLCKIFLITREWKFKRLSWQVLRLKYSIIFCYAFYLEIYLFWTCFTKKKDQFMLSIKCNLGYSNVNFDNHLNLLPCTSDILQKHRYVAVAVNLKSFDKISKIYTYIIINKFKLSFSYVCVGKTFKKAWL